MQCNTPEMQNPLNFSSYAREENLALYLLNRLQKESHFIPCIHVCTHEVAYNSLQHTNLTYRIQVYEMQTGVHIVQMYTGASIPHEAMMHFTLFQIFPLFPKNCSDSVENFPQFYLFL